MDTRAAEAGAEVFADAFVVSLEADCSKPMRPDYMTRRTAQPSEAVSEEDRKPAAAAPSD